MLALLVVLATPALADAPLTQGFEDGAPAWSYTGMWHVQSNPETVAVIPAIADRLVQLHDDGHLPAAFEGSRAAWFGEAATGTYCGADFESIKQTPEDGCTSTHARRGELTSPPFSLVGQTTASLTFRAWWEIEAVRPIRTDLMRVEYSTDHGTTWRKALDLNPSDTGGGRHESQSSGGWVPYSADLTPAAGHPDVRVRFVFDTVDQFRNGFRGLLVDNVAVAGPGGGPITEPGGNGAFTDADPVLSVTGAQLVQTATGGSEVDFTVVASHPVAHPVDFDWTVLGQDGATVATGHGTLAPGQTSVDISVPVSGLDAPYTVSLTSASGASIAATASSASTAPSATPLAPPPLPGPGALLGNPVFKKSFGLGVVSGTVRYHLPGRKYVPLIGVSTLPLGSVVDATKGHARIAVLSDLLGTVQTVDIWQGKAGIFQVGSPAVAELRLAGGNYARCGATTARKAAYAARSRTIRRLWASGKGRFRTKGRYASATVRGTKWVTTDVCTGTRVAVVHGIVAVRDFRRHRTVNVPAGHSVTITALRTGRFRNRPLTSPPRLSRVTP